MCAYNLHIMQCDSVINYCTYRSLDKEPEYEEVHVPAVQWPANAAEVHVSSSQNNMDTPGADPCIKKGGCLK